MLLARRTPALALAGAFATLALVACQPANTRPLSGAVPGQPTPTDAIPPTLTAGEPRLKPLPDASPAISASPSPGLLAVASPSAVAVAPPIVRTVAPAAGASAPVGAPVAVSAVLVGRGAALASATLTVDNADIGAQIQKSSAEQWTIAGASALAPGEHTARVLVRDASGGNGGFTWRFTVGEAAGTPTEGPTQPPAQAATPTTPPEAHATVSATSAPATVAPTRPAPAPTQRPAVTTNTPGT